MAKLCNLVIVLLLKIKLYLLSQKKKKKKTFQGHSKSIPMISCATTSQNGYSTKYEKLRGCLVCVFKQSFSIFKQHFTHFNTLFHPHVFSQIFLNNNFQFLNTRTKRVLRNYTSYQDYDV